MKDMKKERDSLQVALGGQASCQTIQTEATPAGKSAASASNPLGSPQYQKEDTDVTIERENSAWDALGERFQAAAAKGRYLDLTADDDGSDSSRKLSVETAKQDFAAAPAVVNPSTIVQPAVTAPMTTATSTGETDDSTLEQLWSLIACTIEALQEARRSLQTKYMTVSLTCDLHSRLKRINDSVDQIQEYVMSHEDEVCDSSLAMRRLEELNLLVHKANVFVTQFNSRTG